MNIAIFTDNQTAFDQATTAWVARLPECISFSLPHLLLSLSTTF